MKNLNLIMGARNGAKIIREENDFYATHPQATRDFLDILKKDKVKLSPFIWECACGQGDMAKVFREYGFNVYATDLIDRGYGLTGIDFLTSDYLTDCDIFTNPPFKLAEEFAYRGNEILTNNHYFGLFVKIQFLESKSRKILFEKFKPKYIYVYSERQQCSRNGDFENFKAKTQAYIWVIWQKNYTGETVTRWI